MSKFEVACRIIQGISLVAIIVFLALTIRNLIVARAMWEQMLR